MATYLGHTSALKLLLILQQAGRLRTCYPVETSLHVQKAAARQARTSIDKLATELGIPLSILFPIDVLVPHGISRYRAKTTRPHQFDAPMPPEAFLQIREDLYISRPEFCFLQLANTLPLLTLVELGMALCGRYWPAQTDRGFIDHQPLTCAQDLQRFLASCSNTRGVKRARRASELILDNSYSPMETLTALLLCLPRRLGGYGLPRPELNYPVSLSPQAGSIATTRFCKLDICWPEMHFALEYQGRQYHQDLWHDLSRDLALQSMGYHMHYISIEQLRNRLQRDKLARQIAQTLGWRLYPDTEQLSYQRECLIEQLFPCAEHTETLWALSYQQAEALKLLL